MGHLVFPVVLWHSAPVHEVTSVCLAQNTKHAISGGKGGEAVLWSLDFEQQSSSHVSLTPKCVLAGHDAEVTAIASGLRLDLAEPLTAFVTASAEGTLRVWDIEDGCCLASSIRAVPFRPRIIREVQGSPFFIVVGDSTQAIVFDSLSLTPVLSLKREESRRRGLRRNEEDTFKINDLSISAMDATKADVALLYSDGKVGLFSLQLDGIKKAKLEALKEKVLGEDDSAVALSTSQDGRQIAILAEKSYTLVTKEGWASEKKAVSGLASDETLVGVAYSGVGVLALTTSKRRILRCTLSENGGVSHHDLPPPHRGTSGVHNQGGGGDFVLYTRNAIMVLVANHSQLSVYQWGDSNSEGGGNDDASVDYALLGHGDVTSQWKDAVREGRFSDHARVTASAAFCVERPLWVLGHEDGALELHAIPQGTRMSRCHVSAMNSAVTAITVVRQNVWDYANKGGFNSLSWSSCLILAGMADGSMAVCKLDISEAFDRIEVDLNTCFQLKVVQLLYPHTERVEKILPLQVYDGQGMAPLEIDAEPILVSIGADDSVVTYRRGAAVKSKGEVGDDSALLSSLRSNMKREGHGGRGGDSDGGERSDRTSDSIFDTSTFQRDDEEEEEEEEDE
uniref:Uncharacterized protein n=1 Tax=Palpitomonas bilix TaxID=652834 RepID=A0A7S3GCR1_9EUKA|mmetsp:Transcript_43696/g.113901  ORF Transcript_43696/g.113901 Transcript_43696/m.113901 type:complete len:622 (+) Transcript_43696:57-1922(+)